MIADWLMRAMSNLVLTHIVSLAILVSFNYYVYLHANRTPLLTSYLLMSGAPFLWIAGKLMKTVSPWIGLRWFFVMIQYIGMSALGPAFLLFCTVFLIRRRPHISYMVIGASISTTLAILTVTNPWHHLLFKVFTFYRDSFGPLFYILKFEMFACTAIGFLMLLVAVFRYRKHYAIQSFLFILAAAAPLVGSFYYPSLGYRFSGLRFDIVPLCFNITFLFFGIAVFRFDFLKVPPIAHRQLLHALDEGIVITDSDGALLFRNEAAESLSTPGDDHSIGVRDLTLTGFHHGEMHVRSLTDTTIETQRKRTIMQQTRAIRSLTESIEEGIRQEQEILDTQLRNETARELHDVMGHSLTLFISQMESARLMNDPWKRHAAFRAACSALPEWQHDLDAALRDSGHVGNEPGYLSTRLTPLINACRSPELAIDLVTRGKERRMPMNQIRTIYAVVRETLTNSMRHGHANHVLVTLWFGKTFRALIMDNGNGISGICEGNGLSGARKRISDIGGRVEFKSSDGEGFITEITVPIV